MQYQRLISDDGFCQRPDLDDLLEPFVEQFDHLVTNQAVHPKDLAFLISEKLMKRAAHHVQTNAVRNPPGFTKTNA